MKYLYLPIHLIKFWYPESLAFFLKTWKNLILVIEEDLAVSLMFRLLFTPLFHDSSLVGLILSFCFRLTRIVIGLAAFLLVSVMMGIITVAWFLMPAFLFVLQGELSYLVWAVLFSGAVLFIIHLVTHPHLKTWQVDKFSLKDCSLVAEKNINLGYLLKTDQVKQLLSFLETKPEDLTSLNGSFDLNQVKETAWELAKKYRTPYINPADYFIAFIKLSPSCQEKLMQLNLSLEDFELGLEYLQKRADKWRGIYFWDDDFEIRHLKGTNRGWLGTPTPNLDLVSVDLTKLATRENLPDFIGRPEIVNRVINTLSLSDGRNVILVGEVGSGKGALVNYLAKLIVQGSAPDALATKRLVYLDFTKLISGIENQGALAEKIKTIFEEAIFSGNIIIFIDELQNLGLGQAQTSYNLYSLIQPYLESNKLQIITSTEPGNYIRVVEKNSSFVHLFTKIDLPPAAVSDTIQILINRSIELEKTRKLKTSVLAIKNIATLSERYIHDRVLPDSALDVFKKAQVVAENFWITKKVAEKIVQENVKVPIAESDQTAKANLLNLENIIHQKLIDQVEAVTSIANTLRRAAANLRDKNRPIGSFLFVGPTGVGKTELAKILSEEYFSGGGSFLRLDMSEYQSADAINRLIGDQNSEGMLTENIRQNPYTLVLLDEFEKASEKILTLFLQVLDDGRLTDGNGRTIDFTNTIIIATSNAASLIIAQGISSGKTVDQMQPVVKDELLKIFKPELLNRFDATIIFKPLSEDDLQKIVRLKLIALQKQLKEQGYLIDFDEGLVAELTRKGYDPVLGARPLRRLIQDTLEAKLSTQILQGQLMKGQRLVVSSL